MQTKVTDLNKTNFDELWILDRQVNWKTQGLEFKAVSELSVVKILNSSRIFVPNKEKKLEGSLFRKDRVKSYMEENKRTWQITQNWTKPRKHLISKEKQV